MHPITSFFNYGVREKKFQRYCSKETEGYYLR
ncbi:MAG: hypothetical protein J7L82_06035 [Staphylothermus sp.]|nr:hypothetical protein [Staphylothermus sp.]